MSYRQTRRSKETLARMRAGKDAARMAQPAPDYPPVLPELRRRQFGKLALLGVD